MDEGEVPDCGEHVVEARRDLAVSTFGGVLVAPSHSSTSSIPTVIGEILSDSSSRQPIASAKTSGPRWRRTGEGRKANQHTRIDIDDDAWLTVRRDAVRHGLTIARWIGLNLETWARRGDVEES